MAYLYDLTDTWNAAGTVFNAIRMNVTNSASAVGSKIVSLQVGSTDRFTVDKDGNGYLSGTLQVVGSVSSPNVYISGNSGTIGMQDNTASILAYNGTGSGGITNALRFITAASERMRIDSTGNVGIGTSSPGAKLQINAQDGFRFDVEAGAASTMRFGSAGAGEATAALAFTRTTGATTISNGTTGSALTERFRIDGTGNVGIGTSSPAERLDVNGTIKGGTSSGVTLLMADNSAIRNTATGGNTMYFDSGVGAGSTGGDFNFRAAASYTSRLYINGNTGNVGIGTTSPSQKLDVNGSVNGAGNAQFTNAAYCFVGATSGTVQGQFAANAGGNVDVRAVSNHPVTIFTNNTERMRVTATGDVAIGTSSPVAGRILTVNGSPTFISAGSTFNIDLDGSSGANGVGLEASFAAGGYGPLRFRTGGAESMRVTSSGSVGIGTTAPGQTLQVVNAGNYQFRLGGGSTFNYDMGRSGSDGLLYFYGNQSGFTGYVFSGADGERMRINASGNVGIGTSSPGSNTRLNVAGRGLFTSGGFDPSDGTASGVSISYDTGNNVGTIGAVQTGVSERELRMRGNTLTFFTNGANERMRIDSSGSVVIGATSAAGARFNVTTAGAEDVIYVDANTAGAAGTAVYVLPIRTAATFRGGVRWNGTSVEYNTTSDIRLKENITDADDASALIDAIQVRKFDWKETGFHQRYGFVAQELVEVAPEAVSASSDPEEMMGVDYSKLVPMLVKELQSLRARVAQLEGN